MARERVRNACGISQGNLPRRTEFDCMQVPRSQNATGHRLYKKWPVRGGGHRSQAIFGGEHVASRHPSTHLEERSIGTSMEIYDVQASLSRKIRNRPGSLTYFLGFGQVQRTSQSLVKGVSLF